MMLRRCHPTASQLDRWVNQAKALNGWKIDQRPVERNESVDGKADGKGKRKSKAKKSTVENVASDNEEEVEVVVS